MYSRKAVVKSLSESFDSAFRHPQSISRSKRADSIQKSIEMLSDSAHLSASPFDMVQMAIRPIFGKPGVLAPAIGHHPSFTHLLGTEDTETHPITTLFMDIEGSTRLGLIHKPATVFRIKNAFIQNAIAIITAFDGHVHRIMGDAVMAYFGAKGKRPDQGIVDGLNCAATIMLFVKQSVIPRLQEEGFDDQFGIRIGLDFGPEEKVLWSSYGFPDAEEVTATSFYVDVAAKLQQAAGRNRILIGQSLKERLDFPDDLVEVRTRQEGGSEVDEPFVHPNYVINGKPTNYRKYVFRWDRYLKFTPFGQYESTQIPGTEGVASLPLQISIHPSKISESESDYIACGSIVPKNKQIRFAPVIPPTIEHLTVKCWVENHGKEAEFEGDTTRRCSEEFLIDSEDKRQKFHHWEHTRFKGLHYLTVEVTSHRGLLYRTNAGIYIE